MCVALCTAKATEKLGQRPEKIEARLSANILKNAMGVGIPGTGMIGLPIAIARGALIGKSEYQLEVLKGRLLMTTMEIARDLEHRPVARQMRQAILDYIQSDDFQPAITLAPETIWNLYTERAPSVNMFTNDSPDELKPKIK